MPKKKTLVRSPWTKDDIPQLKTGLSHLGCVDEFSTGDFFGIPLLNQT